MPPCSAPLVVPRPDYPVVPFLFARILPSRPSWHFDHATSAVPRYIQLSDSVWSSSSISKRCVAMLLRRALLSPSLLHSAMLATPPCILFRLSSLFLPSFSSSSLPHSRYSPASFPATLWTSLLSSVLPRCGRLPTVRLSSSSPSP